jgi:hypothetical protein
VLAPAVRAAAQTPFAVLATDAIHLAGRSDITIPEIGGDLEGFPLDRAEAFVGQNPETRPFAIDVAPGEELFFDASGAATFTPGGDPSGPDGDVPKDVVAVGGISGFQGLGAALVGVFLDDAIPLADPPAALDFGDAAIGTDFAGLSPELGQVFFIGDGLTGTGSGTRQRFVAPPDATRLFLGTIDGAVPGGLPGYYTDNDSGYAVTRVPESAAGAAGALACGALLALFRRSGGC